MQTISFTKFFPSNEVSNKIILVKADDVAFIRSVSNGRVDSQAQKDENAKFM